MEYLLSLQEWANDFSDEPFNLRRWKQNDRRRADADYQRALRAGQSPNHERRDEVRKHELLPQKRGIYKETPLENRERIRYRHDKSRERKDKVMKAESLTRSRAIYLINDSIDSFAFSHACYCTSNMESLTEEDKELYEQMHDVISILNDDEDYRHDLETMPLEDLKEFLLMCRKMADNNNLSLKSEFPQGNFEIVEDEKTETELNPDKIENEKSFWNTLWGALQGEYNENPTGTEILIDMGLNFIPFVGQACDVRDITACLKKLVIEKRVNEIMIWVTLLLTAIGCVPYAGDVVKAGCKAIIKGADDIVLKILRKLDADDVQTAFKILRSKFTSSIDDATAMVNKWIKEAGNSKYGSKINEVLTGANENLRKAADFVNNKIDVFGEKIFGNGKKNINIDTYGKKEIKSVEISALKNSDSFSDISKQLKKMVPDKYVERASKAINVMPEKEQKEVLDFIEKLYNDFGPKKTMQDHHWIEKSRIGKKKYQFLKNPPMKINLYDDKKNLSLIVGHNGSHKNTYNLLLDTNLDRITKSLEQESLKRKLSIKELFQEEKTIKWINENVGKVITEMQNAVKKDHTIMNNVEKMFILD